jgi:hypothetical protein
MLIEFKKEMEGFSKYEVIGEIEILSDNTEIYYTVIDKTTGKPEMPMTLKVDKLYRLIDDTGHAIYKFPDEILNNLFTCDEMRKMIKEKEDELFEQNAENQNI